MWRALERMREEGPDGPSRALHLRGESAWLTSAKLKLVDGCNLRCFMCDYWHRRRVGELTTTEVERVLEDLRTLGCEKVHFTGGELFLRGDAMALLRRAHGLGMRVNLTSNGTLLSRDGIEEVLGIPVHSITLSLDSPIEEIHDAVRGRHGAYRKTVRTLDRLIERRSKTRVRINTVVSARNYRSLIEMGEFLRDRPLDAWLLIPMDPKDGAKDSLDQGQVRDYNARVAPILAETVRAPGFDPWIYGAMPADAAYAANQAWARGYYRKHLCRVPWFHTLIGPLGDVFPCCMGHRRLPSLGNVRSQSIVEIFRGPAYAAFRTQMLAERTEVCHHCDDFLRENQAFDRWEAGEDA